jgi:hypothetical protein
LSTVLLFTLCLNFMRMNLSVWNLCTVCLVTTSLSLNFATTG